MRWISERGRGIMYYGRGPPETSCGAPSSDTLDHWSTGYCVEERAEDRGRHAGSTCCLDDVENLLGQLGVEKEPRELEGK